MTTETMGQRIRALRLGRDWTQEYLSKLLECSRVNVARIENGHRLPSTRNIGDLCGIFGVSEQYLRTGREIEDGPEFKEDDGFQLVGRPRDRCVAQLYPHTIAKVRSLAHEAGITIPEAMEQIVDYAIRNLKTT